MKEKKEALEIDLNLRPDLSFISPVTLDPSFPFWEVGVMQIPAPSTSQSSSEDHGAKCRSANVQRGLSVSWCTPPHPATARVFHLRVRSTRLVGTSQNGGNGYWDRLALSAVGRPAAGSRVLRDSVQLCAWALLLPQAPDCQITLLSQIFDAVPSHRFLSKSPVGLLLPQTSPTLSPHSC